MRRVSRLLVSLALLATTASWQTARSDTRPLITATLVGLNILVFALMLFSGVPLLEPTAAQVIAWGGNFGPRTFPSELWRLSSSNFVHIGLWHLAVNMGALGDLGRLAERIFGSRSFLVLYLACGLGGSTLSVLWHPMIVSAGASGAIFGVAGALLIVKCHLATESDSDRLEALLGTHRMFRPLSALWVWIGYNLYRGYTTNGVDNAGHLGGLITGFVLGTVLFRHIERRGLHP